MEITVKQGNVLQEPSDLAVLGVYVDAPLPENVAGLLELEDFSGQPGKTKLLYPRGVIPARRLLLVGLGKREAISAESLRREGATAVKQARELQIKSVTVGLQGGSTGKPLDPKQIAQAFAEGLEMGAYRYWTYRTGLTTAQTFKVEQATIYTASEDDEALKAGTALGLTIARGVNFARDLVNSPGYAMTPEKLGEEALKLGERLGLKTLVLGKDELEEQGFGGIMAVGKGSANEPRFIVMEHGADLADAPTICLVGKGLTFDSGGLSLKPADAMTTMKSDMGGAAAVFGAMQVVAELDLPLHVVGLVSSAENMPSSTAYRPGDIVRSLSGQTIEVLNTDAEGRIILADALFYAHRYEPDAIIEVSTLTGAVIIALGAHATGLTATDQALADKILAAGEVTSERVWQLPMWEEYRAMVRSEIADLKNLAGRPAGSITAGAFLAAFTGDYPFVHLDVAGTAWADQPFKPYDTYGGTGVGVRLLTEFLRTYR
ncbi:MAG TPA: leucyl aminopeptidase [Anaerolineales bacterium]|nr:leucyl aminopeptidase [Anaerolineales bacterium]